MTDNHTLFAEPLARIATGWRITYEPRQGVFIVYSFSQFERFRDSADALNFYRAQCRAAGAP